ncbi:histidine protein methyltransferase 1, partial [Cystoisospora suis]
MDVDISFSSSSSSSPLLERDTRMISYLVPLDGAVTPTSSDFSPCSLNSSSSASSSSSSLFSSLPQTEKGWIVKVHKGRRNGQGGDTSRDVSSARGQHQSHKTTAMVEEGVYEGGSAIWECTWDLLQYILRSSISSKSLPAGHVLDLGCGHGLVGLLLLQLGAHTAVFQDLNEEVLRDITKPTLIANLEWREKQLEREKDTGE